MIDLRQRLRELDQLEAESERLAREEGDGQQELDGKRAALLGTTDTLSPRHFAQMLSEHPGIEVLEMIEAPGTRDDIANLKLGRMIREKGIAERFDVIAPHFALYAADQLEEIVGPEDVGRCRALRGPQKAEPFEPGESVADFEEAREEPGVLDDRDARLGVPGEVLDLLG